MLFVGLNQHRDLARDFEYAAQLYARLIVSEVCLPVEMKSIKPATDIRGAAGGMKFICCGSILFKVNICSFNILFLIHFVVKFSLDVQLDDGSFMYGGRERNDSLAMKSGNHELKGLTAFMGSEIQGLCWPLMVVVDYKGYRLVASSLLPISDSTIRYGSSNGGRTIHMSDRTLCGLMREAATKIGLAPLPLVGGSLLFGPSDIEGHKGPDGRYYIVDFSRAMPPEYIARKSRLHHPRSIFFSLLRPELVRSSAQPLCPDAFSGFMSTCHSETEIKRLNKEVYLTCKRLHSVTIPAFVKDLSAKFAGLLNLNFLYLFLLIFCAGHPKTIGSREAIEKALEDLHWLCCETHRRGINFRHLGEVRAQVSEDSGYLSLLLLTEMATRVLKCELRMFHRKVMEKISLPSDAPFRKAAMVMLNTVVGSSDQSGTGSYYWSSMNESGRPEDELCMKQLILGKYSEGLRATEQSPDFDLRRHVSLRLLLLRLQEISCLKFSDRAARDLMNSPLPFSFTDGDIERVEAYAKTLHLVSFAEANISYLRAMRLSDQQSVEALRLLRSAVDHFESALNKATTNLRIMFLLASSLYRMATLLHMQVLDSSSSSASSSSGAADNAAGNNTEEESESGTEDATEVVVDREARLAIIHTPRGTDRSPGAAAFAAASPAAAAASVNVERAGVLKNETVLARVESIKCLVKANSTLDRLIQLCPSDQAASPFVAFVHSLWGELKSELANELRYYIPQKKRHAKIMLGAIIEFKLAFSCPAAFAELRDLVAREAQGEINATNRTRAALAEHKLTKVHSKCQALLLLFETDIEMLLIAGELEVALSKRSSKSSKSKRLVEMALSRFQAVYKLDPLALEEYYKRKRNVLFSVVQQDCRDPSRLIVIQYIISMLNRDGLQVESGWLGNRASIDALSKMESSQYPTSAAEYNLIRPVRDKDGYTDSSGTLWQAMCLSTKEIVGIKIVDSSSWKRLGNLAHKIIKMRRKIQSDKVVHFLQVFEENNCTYFVMPLYFCSAYDLTRLNPDISVRVLFCVVKLAIQALIELHREGAVHGKVTMRNILLVEQDADDSFSIKLTNKAPHIINTVYHRLITGAHDSFSPQKSGWLNKTLLDYDNGDGGFGDATETDEDDADQSSSDTTGTLSLEIRQGSLVEAVKKEAQKDARKSKTSSGPIHKSAKIVKGEDILAVLRMIARIRDMQVRRAATSVVGGGKSLPRGSSSSIGGNNNNLLHSSGSGEDSDDWADLMPLIGGINVSNSSGGADDSEKMGGLERLPLLEEILSRQAFQRIKDPGKELTQYMRRQKISDSRSPPLMRSSASVPNSVGRDSGSTRRQSSAQKQQQQQPVVEIEDPPTPPEELVFASGSKREKLLAKMEDACRRHVKATKSKKSFSSRNSNSPRQSHFKMSLRSLVQNAVAANEAQSSKKKSGLVSLFSTASSPPAHAVTDEFDADWVVAVVVFFYNKTWLMWNALGCTCATMEAGKGKWLWRSVHTGVVAALSPSLYLRYLMGSFHESIHRMNVLHSKLSFDLSSSQRMYAEFREHLRRLMRVFFHVGYNHSDHDLFVASPNSTQDSENSQSDSEPSTPRSPQSSPRPTATAGKRTPGERTSGKRLSKGSGSDKNIPTVSKKQQMVELPADVLWELFHEFCCMFKVDMSEQDMMRKPLFV